MGTKISEFSNGTLPLAGTELVPIVQGGSTVKTTASAFADLAPVQSVAARTGNVVLGIADIGNLQTTLDDKLSISGGVISVNSSTDALRITQTGTGNALIVEDSANPDATPFVVTADGNVGIGTASPLAISGQSSVTVNGTTGGGRVDFLKAGTQYGVINCGQPNLFDVEATGASTALRLNTNGTERVRVTETGNVGIGSATPTSKLSVNGSADFGGVISTGNNISTGDCAIELGANRTASGPAYIDFHAVSGADFASRVYRGAGTNGDFQFQNTGTGTFFVTQTGAASIVLQTNSTERMRIDSSGNVGIGTSAPANKLDILSTGSSQIRVKDGVNATAYYDFGRDGTDGLFGFSGAQTTFSGYKWSINAGSEVMRITNGGNVGIGTGSPGTKLQIVGSATVSGQANVAAIIGAGVTSELLLGSVNGNAPFIGSSGAYPLVLSTNATERMRIDSVGNVGIGTSSPGAALHVSKTLPAGVSAIKAENLSSTTGSQARFDIATATANSYATLAVTDSATPYSEWACGAGVTGGMYISSATTSAPIILRQSLTERMRIDGSGNICIGAGSAGTSAQKVLAISNGVAPTAAVAGVGQLYVEGGALKYRGSSGTITTIANA